MPPKQVIGYDKSLGRKYEKPDIERIGLFVEQPYDTGYKYVFQKPNYREGISMLSGGRKSKNGTQHGYFEPEYKRVFESEGKGARKGIKTVKKDQKLISTSPFLVGGRTKLHSSPGDNYGTFTKQLDAFSNIRSKKSKEKSPGPNFLTRNVKQGGPGYVDICIDKYPEHKSDGYGLKLKEKQYGKVLYGPMITSHYTSDYFEENPFRPHGPKGPIYIKPDDKGKFKALGTGIWMPTGPAKWKAGCQCGTFDKFPEYKPSKYIPIHEILKPFIGDKGPVFIPHSRALKSMFTTSVLNYNVDLSTNSTNYKNVEPTYIKRLID